MVSLKNRLKAVIMLLRPPYWLMTGGLSVLTIIALQKGLPETDLLALVVLSAICISSGGFAFNDYIDQESDAIVKKNRPIPSKSLAPWHALLASVILFTIGLLASLRINWLCFGIAIMDTVPDKPLALHLFHLAMLLLNAHLLYPSPLYYLA